MIKQIKQFMQNYNNEIKSIIIIAISIFVVIGFFLSITHSSNQNALIKNQHIKIYIKWCELTENPNNISQEEFFELKNNGLLETYNIFIIREKYKVYYNIK
jgi:hypothetical protein